MCHLLCIFLKKPQILASSAIAVNKSSTLAVVVPESLPMTRARAERTCSQTCLGVSRH